MHFPTMRAIPAACVLVVLLGASPLIAHDGPSEMPSSDESVPLEYPIPRMEFLGQLQHRVMALWEVGRSDAIIGPDTPDLGEARDTDTVYQADIAATLLAFFRLDGTEFNPDAGPRIDLALASETVEEDR